MPCKNDIKQAVFNNIHDEFIDGRYTFQRLANDTFQITNTGKAKSTTQARAIANELSTRVSKSFNGHVKGEVSQESAFEPVSIKFTVNPKYVDWLYEQVPPNQRTDGKDRDIERDHINTQTGHNTFDTLFEPEIDAGIEVGSYVKYIQMKEQELHTYHNRLKDVQSAKKRASLTKDEILALNKKERELKVLIEGSIERNIKGLSQELSDLKKSADTKAVEYYAEKDLKRLDKLSNSTDIEDLREAERLANFYQLGGTFIFSKKDDNPFFTDDDIFAKNEEDHLTDYIKLPEETVNKFREWANKAQGFQSRIDKRKEELFVDVVNSDVNVKKLYGKLTKEQLISADKGLKDTDWASMWVMDITNGIFSHNGTIPQVMFSTLTNHIETATQWTREIEEKIDKLNPEVLKILSSREFKQSLEDIGIKGLKGSSYQIFKEITKEGNETGGLVQRYVKEYFDASSAAQAKFWTKFNDARAIEDHDAGERAVNEAFEELKLWKRNNTIILDVTRLPEFSEHTDEGHRNELKAVLGEKGYNEAIAKQKELLESYEAERQSFIDTLIEEEGVEDFDKLSAINKSLLSYWEHANSPFKGIEEYNSVRGIFFGERKRSNFMNYNSFVPRKYVPAISISEDKQNYVFSDTNKESGFYSDAFKKIEDNKALADFYDIIKDVCERVREVMPSELLSMLAPNTVPALAKTSAEIAMDKNTNILKRAFESFSNLWEKFRLSFGVNKQSELSYATLDPVTGKVNYKINDQFLRGNAKAISNRAFIEKAKFLQARNRDKTPDNRVLKLSTQSVFTLDSMSEEELILLAQYLHLDVPLAEIQARRLDKFRAITGSDVKIGKYIRDFSAHSVVQSQSFDLAKIAKYFSYMAAVYSAKTQALPILEIMKQYYESIKKPDTTNIGKTKFHVPRQEDLMKGLRMNGIKQMDDWFERRVLDDNNSKHVGVHGYDGVNPKKLEKINARLEEIKEKLDRGGLSQHEKEKLIAEREKLLINRAIPNKFGSDIYSKEDKKKIAEIDTLLEKETDEKRREELIKIKANLGKARTATAAFDKLLNWIRFLGLGYNISSGITNFAEGVTSNMILGSDGNYFDPKEIFYGYHVVKLSFLKNVTFGKAEYGLARKNRKLMDKFRVLMDSRNELQKSSVKTYTDKLSWLSPHQMNQRVEYINQSPIMIAMLRTMKISDKDGNESRLWDAFNNDGHLKEQFRTEENMKDWDDLTGSNYLSFKQKLHKAIVTGHGNYDELRGMMVKSSTIGKAGMMFKTWLPMQVYWRFATQQDDLQSGIKGYKGRYWSYTPTTATIHGAVVGAAALGPIGALIGAAGGYAFGRFGTQGMLGETVRSEVGMLKEIGAATASIAKKALGMPVNLVVGRRVIKQGDQAFDSWIGKGNFTAQDARNMRANMADISIQLMWLALILMVKKLFWDDDDKPNDPERIAHNILINRLMNLSTQAAQYSGNVVGTYKTVVGSNGVINFFGELWKEGEAVAKWVDGDDITSSGPNAGKSNLAKQSGRILLPGLFKDGSPIPYDFNKGEFKVPSLGFETQEDQVFQESYWHRKFRSKEWEDKTHNKAFRKQRADELNELLSPDMYEGDTPDEQEKNEKKDIRHTLDKELPTPSKLKKLDMTREEYNEHLKNGDFDE